MVTRRNSRIRTISLTVVSATRLRGLNIRGVEEEDDDDDDDIDTIFALLLGVTGGE